MTYVLSPERKARYRRILSLGLPIVGGMVSQNVINLVDTAMVGSLGDIALAAVGTGNLHTLCPRKGFQNAHLPTARLPASRAQKLPKT